ncbi:Dyp-type peroxidase [Nocardioides cavernaquae]|uniref:Dyp-type peroxidase n=1 Tax=Nocardioides cavernaquae TaxID=2321396 RepID=UPI001C7D32E7|nr:Dyp-type peroxidase [Nocardioides cavernaquae]
MAAKAIPQDVLAPPARSAIFLVLTVRDGDEAADTVRGVLGDVAALVRSVGFRIPEAQLSCVTGIGSDLWDRLYPEAARPAHLHPFRALAGTVPSVVTGAAHQAPSTPGDLLFHIRSTRQDTCFELSRQLMVRLGEVAEAVDEVHGFRYYDERDLLGFVDGTENPGGAIAIDTVFVGDEDHEFAGSSYVIVQKYLHDLDAWGRLTVEQQQLIVGRTKSDDIELPDDVKPTNSHVAVNTIVDTDGNEQRIVRENMPFGSAGAGEFGTFFCGYAADPRITELMLSRMFIGEPEGNYDRILDFSRAVTGCSFFVPTASFLEDQAD